MYTTPTQKKLGRYGKCKKKERQQWFLKLIWLVFHCRQYEHKIFYFTVPKGSLMLTVARSAVDFSGLEGLWDGPWHSGNVCCAQTSQYFRSFWKKWTLCTQDQRGKGPSRLSPATSPEATVCLLWACVRALVKGNLHCDGTVNDKKYIETLEQHQLPSRQHLFQTHPCILQQDNAKPHCWHITKAWLQKKRVGVPACVQTWLGINGEYVTLFKTQNATAETPNCCTP